jgi:predicted nucleic acid-binding protein
VLHFSVILDACVLYPAPLRDLLLRLGMADLFKARWTETIHEEWITSVLRQGRHTREQLERTRDLMDRHVLDARVTGYEALIPSLTLPDPKDRHVLAAAIKANADAIVTFNLKDFPEAVLRPYSLEAIHPDDFVHYQIDLAPGKACFAIKSQREALKNPPKTKEEFLTILRKQQLPKTVSALESYIDLI